MVLVDRGLGIWDYKKYEINQIMDQIINNIQLL